jgi:hypothetical protein
MKPSKIKLLIASLLIVVGVFLIGAKLFADGGSNMYGYLWSSNIGWIDMNDCSNPADSTTCNPSGSFGVSVLPAAPGTMSGYAWSSNIGWITFNPSGCPTTGCTLGAAVTWNADGSGTVHGWARACSVYISGCSGAVKDDSSLGTWDGYIALDSTTAGGSGGTWGLTITTTKALTGYAWGSQVIGWINSFNATIYVGGPTVILKATPPSINSGASSVLTATAANIDGANACTITAADNSAVPALTMAGSGANWTGTITVSPTLTTTYTVSCTKGSQVAKDQATVNVVYFTTPNAPGGPGGSGGPGGYCSNGYPQFAWSSDATSCVITRSDGASQQVPATSCEANQVFGINSTGTNGLCYYPDNILNLLAGNTTSYTLQCTGGSTPVNLTTVVTNCGQDFSLQAVPLNPTSSGVEPFIVNADGTATASYTVSVIPVSGFTSPVTLTNLPYVPGTGSAALPSDATFTFGTSTLTPSGGVYPTTTFTITIPNAAKELTASGTYSPIVIQGVGGTFTRTVSVSANNKAAVTPIFKEF